MFPHDIIRASKYVIVASLVTVYPPQCNDYSNQDVCQTNASVVGMFLMNIFSDISLFKLWLIWYS